MDAVLLSGGGVTERGAARCVKCFTQPFSEGVYYNVLEDNAVYRQGQTCTDGINKCVLVLAATEIAVRRTSTLLCQFGALNPSTAAAPSHPKEDINFCAFLVSASALSKLPICMLYAALPTDALNSSTAAVPSHSKEDASFCAVLVAASHCGAVSSTA
eukprot:1655902-Rhodomonas_salina.2